jgi:hypothetical protein
MSRTDAPCVWARLGVPHRHHLCVPHLISVTGTEPVTVHVTSTQPVTVHTTSTQPVTVHTTSTQPVTVHVTRALRRSGKHNARLTRRGGGLGCPAPGLVLPELPVLPV